MKIQLVNVNRRKTREGTKVIEIIAVIDQRTSFAYKYEKLADGTKKIYYNEMTDEVYDAVKKVAYDGKKWNDYDYRIAAQEAKFDAWRNNQDEEMRDSDGSWIDMDKK